MSEEGMAREVAAIYGGTWAEPEVRHIETRQLEMMRQTPIVRSSDTVYVPLVPTYSVLDYLNEEMPPITASTARFDRREWQTVIWVPEREEYDAAHNALLCYGHRRIHRFTIWVKAD